MGHTWSWAGRTPACLLGAQAASFLRWLLWAAIFCGCIPESERFPGSWLSRNLISHFFKVWGQLSLRHFQVQMRLICLSWLRAGNYLCRGGTRGRMLKHKEVKCSSVPPPLCELVCIKTPVWQICCRSLPSISSSSSFMISFVGGQEATDDLSLESAEL